MGIDNAIIKIRNRKVELKLTFEYADHIMHNFMHYNPPHDVCFLDIQRIAKIAVYQKEHGRIWTGAAQFKGKIYRIVIIVMNKFAVVKTCYYYKYAKG